MVRRGPWCARSLGSIVRWSGKRERVVGRAGDARWGTTQIAIPLDAWPIASPVVGVSMRRAIGAAMVRYRLTGISPWGVQVEKKDDQREIARRVLNLLADRRMLWRDFSLEIEEHCVRSASETRGRLGTLLDNPEIGDELSRRVKALQAAFRSFMGEVGPYDDMRGYRGGSYGTDPLSVALGQLRGVVGVLVGELASTYGLEVCDELATIVPDLDGWFFAPEET